MEARVLKLLQMEERQASEIVRATESNYHTVTGILGKLVKEGRITSFKRKNKVVYKIIREAWETPHWGFSPTNR